MLNKKIKAFVQVKNWYIKWIGVLRGMLILIFDIRKYSSYLVNNSLHIKKYI